MASKETTPNRSGSQESGSSHEGTSPKTPWDTLKSFAEKGGDLYRRGIELGGTALSAIGARVEGFRSKRDDSRRIELTTPDSEADRNSVEDDKDKVSTSTPESQSGDSGGDEKNDKPVDGGEQQKQEIPEAESRILEERRKRVEAAKERLADVAKKYGEKSEAYKRAESDLQLREDFLRNLESEFGSPAEHSDEPDSDKPEQDRTTPEQGDQEQGIDKGGVPESFVEDVFVPTDFDGNPEDPAQTEVNSSDGQDTSSSSAEGKQDSQGDSEQNQDPEPDDLAERFVTARRRQVERDQAELDKLEPGSEGYEEAKTALEKSERRLRIAQGISDGEEVPTEEATYEETIDVLSSIADNPDMPDFYRQLASKRREELMADAQKGIRDSEENDNSDDQAESSSSAESEQHSQDGGEQNQGPDNISADIVKARRQAAEDLQAKLDGLEPGSEDYEATKAALEESQKRLRHAERSYIEGKSTVEESSSTAETAKKGTDDSVEKTKPAGDASTVETDDSSESETVDDSVEAAKKDLEKERSAVAKDLTEAMQQLSEHKPGDPAYNGLLARVKGLRNRFNYISEQIKEESGADGKRDDIEDKNKGSTEGQETSESEDDKEDKKSPEALSPEDAVRAEIAKLEEILNDPEASESAKYSADYKRKLLLDGLRAKSGDDSQEGEESKKSPEAPTPDDDLEKKVEAARNKYAEIRAEYEQTGMFKKLLKGKELKKRMELARAELEGYMTQLVYQQKDQERSIIVNGVEGANEEEQKEARQKAIQSIAAAVLEQHALVDEKTQEEYDKRLDERSLFKKVAAKIGQWFVGKENKDGGKLGLGGWLRSGGAGLAAGVTLGIFGVSFPISSIVGSVNSAGVKVAAHQRALENARGEKRKLSDEELASFGSAAQSLEWTTEGKDGSDRKDQSGEAVASMVGSALAETQKDTEKRQKNLTAIGSKAAMGWGLGFAAGRVTTELIKNHIIPDQPADPSGGKDAFNPDRLGKLPKSDMLDVPDVTVTPPSETVSLGSDGWVWDRVADVLGAEKATPFLEQLAQTNPDFQLVDLPDGITGIAYQGNTDPQVVTDAIGRVAPDLLKQWVLKA